MIDLDERDVRERLRPLTDDGRFRDAIANITGDRLLLSLFLAGVSHGDGLDDAELAAIGAEDIVRLVYPPRPDLSAGARLLEDLFPDFFEHGHYRYEDHVFGREQYFSVREANRRRLRERGRYSPLNLYLTTRFGHETMRGLLYGSVVDALGRSPLARTLTDRVAVALAIVFQPGGPVAQHNALLSIDRRPLSAAAAQAIELLGRLTAGDYLWAAELAVREMVASYVPYADPGALRARIAGH